MPGTVPAEYKTDIDNYTLPTIHDDTYLHHSPTWYQAEPKAYIQQVSPGSTPPFSRFYKLHPSTRFCNHLAQFFAHKGRSLMNWDVKCIPLMVFSCCFLAFSLPSIDFLCPFSPIFVIACYFPSFCKSWEVTNFPLA